MNFKIPPPPPLDRKIWHFNRANSAAINMTNFPWHDQLNLSMDTNWQVKTFTEIFLNIMSNYISNETKRFVPRDPPWITKPIHTMLNRKNRLFKNYKKHHYNDDDKVRLDAFRTECHKAVAIAKLTYLNNIGNKVNDPSTSQKVYWKIINRVMNKCRAPKIPPLVNNMFILNCSEKAKVFNDFFSKQCMPIITSSVLPPPISLTDKTIEHIPIQCDEILSLIRNLNPNKATYSDGISGQMLLLCDNSVVLPLKIIFQNILVSSSYPDMWKLANVIPIFKKGDKQLIKNYRPISLLPICGKIFEKIIFNNLYNYLNTNNLITNNQCGFSGGLLKLFENDLHNRKQRVVLNGTYSDYSSIESGVPQGSVLDPLLFLVYINDLESNINSNIKFFADDTMLFSVVQDSVKSATDLNHDLNMIS